MYDHLTFEQRRSLDWFEWMGDNLHERHIVRAELRSAALRSRYRAHSRRLCFNHGTVYLHAHIYRDQWRWKR